MAISKLHHGQRLYNANYIPGNGPIPSLVMLIGEAPGRNEDHEGKPFVGRAGQLLDAELYIAGMPRHTVYVTNAVKCRPPANRKPTTEEIMYHRPYLLRELQAVAPRVIVTLGATAFEGLIGRVPNESIFNIRKRIIRFKGIRVIPTYHPASTFHDISYLSTIKADLKKAKEVLKWQELETSFLKTQK